MVIYKFLIDINTDLVDGSEIIFNQF